MLKQFEFSIRRSFAPRFVVLMVAIVLNVTFGLGSILGVYKTGGQITAVVLCSCALLAIMVVSIISDFEAIKDLFSAPAGYSVFLAPVASWKILFGRALSIVLCDAISFALGIVGVIAQTFILTGLFTELGYAPWGMVFWGIIVFLVNYLILILAIFLSASLSKSVLYRFRGRTLLAVIITIAIIGVLSFLNFILMPLTAVDHYGLFYSINIGLSLNPAMIVYILLCLCKAAALFCASTYLMERKINI